MSNQPPQGPPEGWERPQQQGWGQPPPGAQGPPTQPQWGQQPPQPPKPKPPLYRRPWFIIVGIVVLVVVAAGLFGDPPAEEQASQGTVAPTTAAQATNAPTTAGESEPETTAKPATTARESDLRALSETGNLNSW